MCILMGWIVGALDFVQKNTPIGQYISWIEEIKSRIINFLKGYSGNWVKYKTDSGHQLFFCNQRKNGFHFSILLL